MAGADDGGGGWRRRRGRDTPVVEDERDVLGSASGLEQNANTPRDRVQLLMGTGNSGCGRVAARLCRFPFWDAHIASLTDPQIVLLFLCHFFNRLHEVFSVYVQ